MVGWAIDQISPHHTHTFNMIVLKYRFLTVLISSAISPQINVAQRLTFELCIYMIRFYVYESRKCAARLILFAFTLISGKPIYQAGTTQDSHAKHNSTKLGMCTYNNIIFCHACSKSLRHYVSL